MARPLTSTFVVQAVKNEYAGGMGRTRGFDEATVLETIRGRFWAQGYEGTSTYDLMDATGLGKGSIYKAFGNKHELYLRTFSDYCDELVAGAELALGGTEGDSPRARISEFLVGLAHEFGAESPRRGCFLTKATVDLAGFDSSVAEVAKRAFERIAGAFASAVRDAQAAGEVDPDADAETLGYLMLTVIRGIDTIARSGLDESTLVGVAETAVAMLPA